MGLYLDIFNDHGNSYDPNTHIVTYKMSKFRPTHKVYWSHLGKQLWLVMPTGGGELCRTRCVVVDVDDKTSTVKLVLLKPNAWKLDDTCTSAIT